MAIMSYFKQGFAGGVNIRGVPLVTTHPGQVFWVSNAVASIPVGGLNGSDATGQGFGTFHKPYATLAFASSQCLASRGDIIMVKAGHAETYSSATAITLSTAGVMVIGLGTGALRPTFTLDTANTTTINVTAGQIGFHNVVFVANFLAIASAFTLTTAKDFTLSRVEFRDTSSALNFVALVTTAATSNAADGLTIVDTDFFGLGTSSLTTMVSMLGTNTRVSLSGCYLQNKSVSDGGAVMIIATGKVVTHLKMMDNIFNTTGVSSGTAGTLITTDGSTNTGVLARNLVRNLDATTEILVTASSGFVFFDNKSTAVADTSGYLLPIADA